METKPFNLQSPEQIAKDYGGNKQKIAQAMQMGIIDPTAGTLAGMFIDRMRSAAQQEVAPQQTVAQQTFAPPAPPAPPMPPPGGAGLGAIAPGGAPPAPPPMGGPPMGPPPPMEPPSPMGPPPGMASGGIVGLPLPDSMFDEPSNGGYAGGGIVAFAEAGAVKKPKTSGERMAEAFRLNPEAVQQGMVDLEKLAPRETKYSDMQRQQYERELTPEAMAARKKQDMWMTLAQIGAKMATTPGGFLRGAAAGIESALPGAQEMAKERRQEMRQAMDALAAQEGATNKQRMELLNMSYAMQLKVADAVAKGIELEQALQLAREEFANREKVANIGASAQRYSADRNASAMERQMQAQQFKESEEGRKWVRQGLQAVGPYMEAVRKGDFATARAIEDKAMRENGIPVFSAPAPSGGGSSPAAGSQLPPGTVLIN